MKMASQKERILTACEYAVAILMTLCAIALHGRVLTHAGPLWRDEVNGLNVALMPDVQGVWQSIVYYPFPILHDLVLRFWIAFGFGQSDFQLRVLAFLIALLLLGAVWLASWILNREMRAPFWPLALLALNPVLIQNGDWVRPYALAMMFIILTFAVVWRITIDGRGMRFFVLAIVLAILSVQTVFLNAVLVFAICLSGIVVAARRKQWRTTARIMSIGAAAALSLLPYLPVLRQARAWSSVVRMNSSFQQVIAGGIEVLAGHNPLVAAFWILVPVVATIVVVKPRRTPSSTDSDVANNRKVFGLISLVVGAAGTVGFLLAAGWLMDRYFVPFAALASFCVYLFAGALKRTVLVRLANLAGATAIACIFLPSAYVLSATRATNCDLVAASLARDAGQNDLILLTSFTFGMSFARYYHGPAQWKTVPDVADRTQHRWDLVVNELSKSDPLRDTLLETEAVLRSGHKVFVVGALPASAARSITPPVDEESLRGELGQFLRRHVAHRAQLPVDEENQIIYPLEDLPLFVGSGWLGAP